jgi:hypothetical protein
VFDELPDKSCPSYVRQFWAKHLAEAGKWEKLHKVVATGDSEKQLWAETHYSASGSYADYLSDLSLAWEHADEIGVSDGSTIGRQVRYALIKSSIHSLALNIPVPLLLMLVKHKMWTPVQGLAYARQTPGAKQRARALTGLAPYLPERLQEQALREALVSARDIESNQARFRALAGLIPRLPQPLEREVRTEIQAIEGKLEGPDSEVDWKSSYRAWDQSEKAWRKNNEEVKAALAKESAIDRTEALLKLAVKLPKGDQHSVLRVAWETAQTINCTDARITKVRRIAAHLPERGRRFELEKALDAARAITCADIRATALTCLEHHLPEAKQCTALKQSLLAIRGKKNVTNRAEVQARLESHMLKSDRLRSALEAAQAIGGDKAEQEIALVALAALVPCLAKLEYQEEALEVARTLPRRKIGSVGNLRAEALVGLVPYLTEAKRCLVMEEALEAVWVIGDSDDRTRALATLASYLPEALWSDVLTAEEVREGEFEDWILYLKEHSWQRQLYDQAPSLSQESVLEVKEALARERVRSTFTVRDLGLEAVAYDLAKQGYPQEALATIRAVEDESDRVEALAELTNHLPEPFSQQALEDALETTHQIKDRSDVAGALMKLAPHIQVCRDRFYPIWCETLHHLAYRTRKDLLFDIRNLAPAIHGLGDEEAIAETFRAIQDVGRWWP